jgi:hypothetical protein
MPVHDAEFRALRCAKSWGLTPRQWREESIDDRALMLALDMFEGTTEAKRTEFREERRKKEEKQNSSKDDLADMERRRGIR